MGDSHMFPPLESHRPGDSYFYIGGLFRFDFSLPLGGIFPLPQFFASAGGGIFGGRRSMITMLSPYVK